jgi:hypothetical protein
MRVISLDGGAGSLPQSTLKCITKWRERFGVKFHFDSIGQGIDFTTKLLQKLSVYMKKYLHHDLHFL